MTLDEAMALITAERARADAAEARLAMCVDAMRALRFGASDYAYSKIDRSALGKLTTVALVAEYGAASSVEAFGERVRFEAERRVRAEMNGAPDERIAGLKRRAKELIERDPKEALANVLTALADDPEAYAEARATAEQAGFARGVEAGSRLLRMRANDVPADQNRSVYNVLNEAADALRALSPHPAAPCPNANLIGWTDLPCEHCGKGHGPASRAAQPAAPSPAQPVAVGGVAALTYAERQGLRWARWQLRGTTSPSDSDDREPCLAALDRLIESAPPPIDRELLRAVAKEAAERAHGNPTPLTDAAIAKAVDSALAEHGKVRR